jgi:hypothetical protein
MAEEKKKEKVDQLEMLNVTVLSLVALVAVVSIVALIMHGGVRFSPRTVPTEISEENSAGDLTLTGKPRMSTGIILTGTYTLDDTRYAVTYSSYKKSLMVNNLDDPQASSALAILFGISPYTGTLRCDAHKICSQAPVAVTFDANTNRATFAYPEPITVQLTK